MDKFLNHSVNKKNLIEFLTPTSKGTKWYDPPPENLYNERVLGRLLLQYHQVAEKINKSNFSKNLKFMDVGTGNGLLPELISKSFTCKKVIGIDPYEDGEHKTSNPKGTRNKLLNESLKHIKNGYIDFNSYKSYIKYEGFSEIPQKFKLFKPGAEWKFIKKTVNQLSRYEKFNFIFAKCIDHISNWENLIKEITIRSEKNSMLIIKHNSYFSYNGAHRYASIGIPWGHIILNEKEYKRYVERFHKNRKKEMIDFYYNGLNYPRSTVGDLIKFATKNGFKLKLILCEPPRFNEKSSKYLNDVKNFWEIIKKNYPKVSNEEVLSGIYHIVLEKI